MTLPTTSTCAGQNAWPLRYSFDPLPPAHNGPAVETSTPVRITTSNLRFILAPPGSEMGTQDLQYRPVHRLPVSSGSLCRKRHIRVQEVVFPECQEQLEPGLPAGHDRSGVLPPLNCQPHLSGAPHGIEEVQASPRTPECKPVPVHLLGLDSCVNNVFRHYN